MRARRVTAAAAAALILAAVPVRLPAQASRAATTAAALVAYPVFFHGRAVVVRGELRRQDRSTVLIGPGAERSVYLHFTGTPPPDGPVEVRGDAIDIGRLGPDDPRLTGIDVDAILQVETQGRWPNSGELVLIKVSQATPPRPPPVPSVRAVALEPDRYADQRVTVVGRFRGANLYADLPDSPGQGRWDFVLQSADSALWVTGLRPRGKGVDLDPRARVDTGRWIEVSGVVKNEGGLVWIEGQQIGPADAPEETEEEPSGVIVPPQGPPPEVVFSAPIQDDTDVPTTVTVRIQFSRDMKAESFVGQVRGGYFGAAGGEPPALPSFTVRYRDDARVLEIAFDQPLERFRTVRIELLEGIETLDGARLAPWTLTFSVGASERPSSASIAA